MYSTVYAKDSSRQPFAGCIYRLKVYSVTLNKFTTRLFVYSTVGCECAKIFQTISFSIK